MCYKKIEDRGKEQNKDYCDVFPSRGRILLRTVKFMDLSGISPDPSSNFDVQYAVISITIDQARKLALELMAIAEEDGVPR